jgi:hypothetical protein
MELYQNNKSDVYQEYLGHIKNISQDNINLSKPWKIVHDGKAFLVKQPKYSNAHEAYRNEHDMLRKIEIGEYIQIHEKLQKLRPEHFKDPVYYISTLPVISETGEDVQKQVKPKRVVKRKATKSNTKAKAAKEVKNSNAKSKLSPQAKVAFVNSSISRILGVDVPFATHDQCISRSTSAKYYLSKANLVELIKAHPKLIEVVGKKYYTMSKEDICKKLFEASKNSK